MPIFNHSYPEAIDTLLHHLPYLGYNSEKKRENTMAVHKVYWDNPYLTSLSATVTSTEGGIVTLDQTIFYAFSGGQASDRGTIGGYLVLDARKVGLEIEYLIPEMHTLSIGDTVNIEIDPIHRDALRRLHFAAELVLELVYQNFAHPEKKGRILLPKKRLWILSGMVTSPRPSNS